MPCFLKKMGWQSLLQIKRSLNISITFNYTKTLFKVKFLFDIKINEVVKIRKKLIIQVGSFNYDNTKMIYRTYYLPLMPNSTESILDYRVDILNLKVT